MQAIQTIASPAEARPKKRDQFERFFDEVRLWLGEENAPLQQLIQWLNGSGVPAPVYGGQPAQWLFKALQGANRERLKKTMARRLVKLLAQKPDMVPVGNRPEDLLENLFNLAGLLEDAECLGEPLLEIFRRNEHQASPLMQDLGVKTAFATALAHNQRGDELCAVWLGMLCGKNMPSVAGDELSGLVGLLSMPSPCITEEVLCRGLAAFAKALTGDAARRRMFSAAIEVCERITAQKNNVQPWLKSTRFVEQAITYGLPSWVIECAPTLYAELDLDSDPKPAKRFLAWSEFVKTIGPILPAMKIIETPPKYGGFLDLVEIPTAFVGDFQKRARLHETNRRLACSKEISEGEFIARTQYHPATEMSPEVHQHHPERQAKFNLFVKEIMSKVSASQDSLTR